MYEAYYGLLEKPFSILPDPDLIYWGDTHRLAFAMLEFGVMNLISNTPQGKAGLLQWVMMSLNQPHEGSYPTLYLAFQRFLHEQYSKGRRTILIVDEAQNLGLEALEELRMLSNVNADKNQFLQIILVGQPQLKDMLRTPQLLQFAQRVSSDFHLKPLIESDVTEYVNFRLKAVGSRFQLFSQDACKMIAIASCGIPRTINILCDTALVYGFAANAKHITPDLVTMVIENKQQYGVLPLTALPVYSDGTPR
jgi:general secretion pathway protein A